MAAKRQHEDSDFQLQPSSQVITKKRKTYFCPHCDRELSKSAYYDHLALFYDRPSKSWKRSENQSKVSSPDFVPRTDASSQPMRNEDFSPNNECVLSYSSSDSGETTDNSDTESVLHEDVEVWNHEKEDEEIQYESAPIATAMPYTQKRLIKWYSVVMFTYQCLFSLSDGALGYILSFFAKFLVLVATFFSVSTMKPFAAAIPSTLQKARSFIKHTSNIQRYASCPKCDTLYDPSKCTEGNADGSITSKLCTHIKFPCHPRHSMRSQCQCPIMKPVRGPTGNTFFYPYRTFAYVSIIHSLESIISRNATHLNHWESDRQTGVMFDIYDGRVWDKIRTFVNEHTNSICLSFTLNVDWFQPFDHVAYSVGAIYLAINNLPRHFRFKQHNVILAGLIPGPNEPENINPYIVPLLEELKILATGVTIAGRQVYGILSCVANDVPAARKICGFAGHSGRFACTKCKKPFPTLHFGEKPDYSGYNVSSWITRSDTEVQSSEKKYLQAKTKQEKKKIIREDGCRYSVLQDLPHFSVVTNTVIDPMHNLFLGTSKHTFETWKAKSLISKEHFFELQKLVDNIAIPRDVGRIPHKINSGFSGFTADQWRLWTVVYSVICLTGVLPSPDLECWRQFIIACTLFCSKVVTVETINVAHEYVVRFCQLSSILYGNSFCTLNMHLHCHLKEVLLDYGPVHSFWLFSFERYNGILGDIPNNHHAITVQLLKKFTQAATMASMYEHLPPDLEDTFGSHMQYGKLSGSVQLNENPTSITARIFPKLTDSITNISWEKDDIENLCPTVMEKALNSMELENLKRMYELLYTDGVVKDVCRIITYSHRAVCGSLKFSSLHVSSSAAVIALWGSPQAKICCGIIDYIFQSPIKVLVSESIETRIHTLAKIQWFIEHPLVNVLGFPWKIFYNDYQPLQSSSFIPLSRIAARCAMVNYSIPPSVNMQYAHHDVIALAPIDFISSEFTLKYMVRSV